MIPVSFRRNFASTSGLRLSHNHNKNIGNDCSTASSNEYCETVINLAKATDDQLLNTCLACRLLFTTLLNFKAKTSPHFPPFAKANLSPFLLQMCALLQIASQEMCYGLINEFQDEIIFILNSSSNLTSSKICSLVLPGQCGPISPSMEFSVKIDSKYPFIKVHNFFCVSVPVMEISIYFLNFSPKQTRRQAVIATSKFCT